MHNAHAVAVAHAQVRAALAPTGDGAWRARVRSTHALCALGGTLVRACEGLAQNWGFDEVYLHAATQKSDLLSMYAAMRYEALPAFDQPWWVLALSGREPTRYHRKALPAAAASLPE